MPVTNGFVDVAYGILLTGDPELMFVTMAWEAVSGPEPVENLEGHYGRFTNRLRTCWDLTVSFPECRFTFGTASGNVPIVINPEVPTVGNRAAIAQTPNNCAVLARKTTALGGRKNRGRMFLPCPAETNVSAIGNLATVERTLFQTALDNWLADEQLATNWNPALLHSDGVTTPTLVTGMQVQTKIATQRRRMRP